MLARCSHAARQSLLFASHSRASELQQSMTWNVIDHGSWPKPNNEGIKLKWPIELNKSVSMSAISPSKV